MKLEALPNDTAITMRRDDAGRLILETPPEGLHPGFAIGMLFWGGFGVLAATMVGVMYARSVPATVIAVVFFLLGSWSVYRAWLSSRSARRITDLGDSIEIGYLVRGGVTMAKVFDKDNIKKLAIQPIWSRRDGVLGTLLGSSKRQSSAQPESSHLHGIFIRSSLQVDTLGFSLAAIDRDWLLEAIRQLVKE